MRSDEGKGGKADFGLKPNMKAAKPKVGAKKEDLAGRMKAKGMPYTQSVQSGKFDQVRGQRTEQWGPKPNFARGGGMPYDMWGPSAKDAGFKKSGEQPEMRIKREGGRGRA